MKISVFANFIFFRVDSGNVPYFNMLYIFELSVGSNRSSPHVRRDKELRVWPIFGGSFLSRVRPVQSRTSLAASNGRPKLRNVLLIQRSLLKAPYPPGRRDSPSLAGHGPVEDRPLGGPRPQGHQDVSRGPVPRVGAHVLVDLCTALTGQRCHLTPGRFVSAAAPSCTTYTTYTQGLP